MRSKESGIQLLLKTTNLSELTLDQRTKLSAIMPLLPLSIMETLQTSAPSSSSSQRVEKRCRSFSGMSITRIGSEDGDDDSEHTHICKKISHDYESARNLLVSPPLNNLNFDDIFFNFLADMPLPEDYNDCQTKNLNSNGDAFCELDNFLKSTGAESTTNPSGFWDTMYIMEQESH